MVLIGEDPFFDYNLLVTSQKRRMRYESMCRHVDSLPPDEPLLEDEFLLSCEGLGPIPAQVFLHHNAIFLLIGNNSSKGKSPMILKLPFCFDLGLSMRRS